MPVTPNQPRPMGGHPPSSQRDKQRASRPQFADLLVKSNYKNTLPDPPFQTKFLPMPMDTGRFTEYKPTTLERTHKFEHWTEHDLGIAVDLVLPDAYAVAEHEEFELDPKDERLLEEDFGSTTDRKRSQRHAKPISWMRKPDYISTEQTRYQPTTIDKVESKVGFSVFKKGDPDAGVFMDREAQINKIEKTFDDTKTEIINHHSKKGVVAESVMPLLPDGDMWKFPCAQVIFDSDPAPHGVAGNLQNDMMSQAMIRGVMDEFGEQFVAYFLPTEDTMEKRQRDFAMEREYDEDQEYEYKMAREYNWIVKSKAHKGYEENYFFVLRDDGFHYNELETRVRLSKRRLKAGQQASNSKLVVRHRPLNKQELKMQRYRERNLEPPMEEEEDKESSAEEEEEQLPETGGGDEKAENRSRSNSASSRGSGRSRSRSASGSRQSSRSRSGSPAARRSRSKSRSRSRSASGSRSGSGSRSSSRSRSKSPSGSE